MNSFQPTVLSRHPRLAIAVRGAVTLGIVGMLAAAWATAGPGNWYQEPVQVTRVTLPTVVVVGQRADLAAGSQAASADVACSKRDAAHRAG